MIIDTLNGKNSKPTNLKNKEQGTKDVELLCY